MKSSMEVWLELFVTPNDRAEDAFNQKSIRSFVPDMLSSHLVDV